MSRLLSRDPFARTELHRRRIYQNTECAWCGHTCRTPLGRPFLYEYTLEHDAGRKTVFSRLFCSSSCFRSYH